MTVQLPVENEKISFKMFQFKSNPGGNVFLEQRRLNQYSHHAGAGSSPLRLRSFWKAGDQWQQLKLEYCYNTRLKNPIDDVTFLFKFVALRRCKL